MLRVGARSLLRMGAQPRPFATPLGARLASSNAAETEENIVPIRYAYYVPRVGVTASSLPVYSDVRHGGNKWLTVIRKIDGDVPVRLC